MSAAIKTSQMYGGNPRPCAEVVVLDSVLETTIVEEGLAEVGERVEDDVEEELEETDGDDVDDASVVLNEVGVVIIVGLEL
ncbi:MAG TPA: hypothetical protein VEH01_00290, partial [Nitrososphaerales archaeon]|nr:hypothetical protein [Nitrososphaerales archaeon]